MAVLITSGGIIPVTVYQSGEIEEMALTWQLF